jgi:hypothetical protein
MKGAVNTPLTKQIVRRHLMTYNKIELLLPLRFLVLMSLISFGVERTMADVNIPTSAGKGLDQYLQSLESTGWNLTKAVNPLSKSVTIQLEKLKPKSEPKGIFGIRWDAKETIKLEYIPQEKGKYKLYQFEGQKELKAPLLGDWEVAEKYNELPELMILPPNEVEVYFGE